MFRTPPSAAAAGRWCVGMLAAVLLAAGTAQAAFPERAIRLVVPFPPGGAADLMARLLGQKLAYLIGAPVVLDNRGGAGGTIAAEAVAKAPADGYTLLFGTMGTHAINPNLYRHLRYDPLADFAPVALTHSTPRVLMVHPGLPARSVAELVALARATPGALTFGSAGNGSSGHLAGEYLKSLTGVEMTHVPYKGTAAAMLDLLAGRISISIDAPAAYLDAIRGGRVRALGVTSPRRMAVLPEVPTFAEAGIGGFEVSNWLGILAPRTTPPAVIDHLQREITRAMTDAEMRRQLAEVGIEPLTGTPVQFTAFMKAELAKWERVVRISGARVD